MKYGVFHGLVSRAVYVSSWNLVEFRSWVILLAVFILQSYDFFWTLFVCQYYRVIMDQAEIMVEQ